METKKQEAFQGTYNYKSFCTPFVFLNDFYLSGWRE